MVYTIYEIVLKKALVISEIIKSSSSGVLQNFITNVYLDACYEGQTSQLLVNDNPV